MGTSPSFDTAFAAYRDWIGWSGVPFSPEHFGGTYKSQRIIGAGDFHVPFHDRQAVKELIDRESRTADLLVLNGDLADCWSTSRWPKSKRETDPRSEFLEAQVVLTTLAEHFKEI